MTTVVVRRSSSEAPGAPRIKSAYASCCRPRNDLLVQGLLREEGAEVHALSQSGWLAKDLRGNCSSKRTSFFAISRVEFRQLSLDIALPWHITHP